MRWGGFLFMSLLLTLVPSSDAVPWAQSVMRVTIPTNEKPWRSATYGFFVIANLCNLRTTLERAYFPGGRLSARSSS